MFPRWHLNAVDLEFSSGAFQQTGFAQAERLTGIGNRALLGKKRTALFCSRQCPGQLILLAHEWSAHFNSNAHVIISGFHTPIEQECLRLFLRSRQPAILCPARGIERFRVPMAYRKAIEAGALLLLSPFDGKVQRSTRTHAHQRNAWVAALADELIFIHAAPGSRTEELSRLALAQGKPCFTFDAPANRHLLQEGVRPMPLPG